MRKQAKQPELPGCPQGDMRFKDIPCTNADGQDLKICTACDGSGTTCTAKRTTYHKTTGEPKDETAAFPGSEHNKYTRGGWTVTSTRCRGCGGAGLKLAGGRK